MAGVKALTLGWRTVVARPKFVVLAWLLHAVFAALASAPAVSLFTDSIAHRPAFSNELLNDFSIDLLLEWRAAFGTPLRTFIILAATIAVLYAAAKVLFDCFLFPAYLAPFEDFRDGRLGRAALNAAPDVVSASLGGLGVSLILGGFIVTARDNARIVVAIVMLAVFVRVIANLWKCGGLGDAITVMRARPGTTLWLTVMSTVVIALYGGATAFALWTALGSAHPFLMFACQQALVAIGVVLRLWLAASAVVLWRSVMMSNSYV